MTEHYYLKEMLGGISAELEGVSKKIQKNTPAHPLNLSMNYDMNYGLERICAIVKLIEKSYFHIRTEISNAISILDYPSGVGYMKTDGESIDIDDEAQTILITLPQLLPLKSKAYAYYLPMKLHSLLLTTKIEYSRQNKNLPFFEKTSVVFFI